LLAEFKALPEIEIPTLGVEFKPKTRQFSLSAKPQPTFEDPIRTTTCEFLNSCFEFESKFEKHLQQISAQSARSREISVKSRRIHDKVEKLIQTEKIKLNVGGMEFVVSLDILNRISNVKMLQTENGFFVNRDFTVFHHLLSYLRSGCLPADLEPTEMSALRADFEFYGVQFP
jgi:hypothetical protein